LAEGTYAGTIAITDANASNNPQQVSVTLAGAALPTDNEITITCNPSSGGTGTTVTTPVSIKAISEILVFLD